VPTDCMDEGAIANAVKAAAQRRHPLPKMRFIVISRGVPEGPMTTEVVPGIDKAIESKWQQEQIKLAHLVPGGKRIVATQRPHDPDRPTRPRRQNDQGSPRTARCRNTALLGTRIDPRRFPARVDDPRALEASRPVNAPAPPVMRAWFGTLGRGVALGRQRDADTPPTRPPPAPRARASRCEFPIRSAWPAH
jgi:hypothetical protein